MARLWLVGWQKFAERLAVDLQVDDLRLAVLADGSRDVGMALGRKVPFVESLPLASTIVASGGLSSSRKSCYGARPVEAASTLSSSSKQAL